MNQYNIYSSTSYYTFKIFNDVCASKTNWRSFIIFKNALFFFVYLSYFYWNNKGILIIWSYSTFFNINVSYNNICRKCRFWSDMLNWISLIKHWDKRYPLHLWKESATIAPLNKQDLCQRAFLLFHTNLIKIKIMHF